MRRSTGTCSVCWRRASQLGPSDARPADGDDDEEPIAADAQPEDPLASGGVKADSGWEGTPEERPPAVDQLVPSAFGLTFCLDSGCDEPARRGVVGRVRAADQRGQARRASGPLGSGGGGPAAATSRFRCRRARSSRSRRTRPSPRSRAGAGARPRRAAARLAVSRQRAAGRRPALGRALAVPGRADGARADGAAVFVRRALDAVALAPEVDRGELAGLELLHRHSVELAVGHGVGVEATYAPGTPGPRHRAQDRG